MKGKNILVTAACVIGFGGIIGNTLVGVATSRELRKQIPANKADNDAKIDQANKDAKEADEAYKASTVAELKAMAKDKGLKGYSTMKKDELIKELEK